MLLTEADDVPALTAWLTRRLDPMCAPPLPRTPPPSRAHSV
jgi:hypothetical protein